MHALSFSQIKEIKAFCESLVSEPDWREVVGQMVDSESDFEVDNVRFISDAVIDDVLADELANDEYVLGCFAASAIAEATGWPIALIEAAQKGEAYQEIGEAMTSEHVRRLAEIYSSADGYGHHFNGYDFSEEELAVKFSHGTVTYHVFDNR